MWISRPPIGVGREKNCFFGFLSSLHTHVHRLDLWGLLIQAMLFKKGHPIDPYKAPLLLDRFFNFSHSYLPLDSDWISHKDNFETLSKKTHWEKYIGTYLGLIYDYILELNHGTKFWDWILGPNSDWILRLNPRTKFCDWIVRINYVTECWDLILWLKSVTEFGTEFCDRNYVTEFLDLFLGLKSMTEFWDRTLGLISGTEFRTNYETDFWDCILGLYSKTEFWDWFLKLNYETDF